MYTLSQIRDGLKRRVHSYKVNALRKNYELPSVNVIDVTKKDIPIADPIMEGICMPPYLYKKHDDFGALMKLAKFTNAKTIVELGTAHGNTSANLCKNCPDAKVYTVNAPVEAMTGDMTTYDLSKEEIGIAYRNSGYSNRVVQIFENTLHLDLSKYFKEPIVDFAIVDACHDTDYVINDFHKVLPFMKADGIILLHDTHPSMEDHLGGSYVACMELRKEGHDIRHVANTWWGIWRKKW